MFSVFVFPKNSAISPDVIYCCCFLPIIYAFCTIVRVGQDIKNVVTNIKENSELNALFLPWFNKYRIKLA